MEVLEDKLSQETRRNYAVNTAKSAIQSQPNYLPWQRTSRPTGSGLSRLSSTVPSQTCKTDPESRPFSVATVRTACSSKCQHSWNKKCVVPPINVEEEKKRRRLLTALKMQIKMKELSLCEYKKVFQKLLAENSKIKQEIAESEEKNHSESKSLLQRYERFRGAIGSLQKQYQYQSTEYLEDYGITEGRILKEVQELQRQADQIDVAVCTKNNEVKTLVNYKEKEYPGKIQAIAKLKRQRERLRIAHQNELEELLTTINEDTATSLAKEELLNNNVRDLFTEEAILSMNDQTKEVALQNMIMKKEIEIHKDEVKQLKSDISQLQAKIL
ncbi:Hypothetical predicted protein [Paramuricea clavata]|nr:Hypothetical predicted protein [Paramuricea clavata]